MAVWQYVVLPLIACGILFLIGRAEWRRYKTVKEPQIRKRLVIVYASVIIISIGLYVGIQGLHLPEKLFPHFYSPEVTIDDMLEKGYFDADGNYILDNTEVVK